MFGYLIPRSYKEALVFDKENNQGRNGLHQGATSLHQTPKGQMGFKSQENPKCTSQSPENQDKLNICGETQWETQDKACT